MFRGLKRFVMWDFPRGSWQYDLMCGAIIAFIFLSPRDWFHDQPRIPHASQVMSLPGPGESAFWIEPELVNPISEPTRLGVLGKVLAQRTGKKIIVLTRIEPIFDSEHEIKGYLAWAKP